MSGLSEKSTALSAMSAPGGSILYQVRFEGQGKNWRQSLNRSQKNLYLCAVGEEAYILPEKYTPLKSRAAAYLFTDTESTVLFSAIDQMPSTKKEPFLNEMAHTLYRLIYTCGLRPNEGREPLAENINFETGGILITHTKRSKERFVVMSDDMLVLARRY